MYFVCYSLIWTAVAPLNAHVLKIHDDHSDFGADIKLHGNGGPLAIPNPYSSSRLTALLEINIIVENEIANCYIQHVSCTCRGTSPHIIQASSKN